MKLFLALALLICGLASSRAATPACIGQKFGEKRYATSTGSPPMLALPRGFKRPVHGLVLFLGGLVQYPRWWIVDIDNRTLTNAMTIRLRDVAYISVKGYSVTHLANGDEFAVKTIGLDRSQLSSIICRANALWSYESPFDIEMQAFIHKYEEWKRDSTRQQLLYKNWVHDTDRCPKRRDCAGPPPPPAPPMTAPLPRPPALSVPTIDTIETITLLDGRTYRGFGSLGPLQGVAAAFAQWLMSIPARSQ